MQTQFLAQLNGVPTVSETGGSQDMQKGHAVICAAPDGSPLTPIKQMDGETIFRAVEGMLVVELEWDRYQGEKIHMSRLVNMRDNGSVYLGDFITVEYCDFDQPLDKNHKMDDNLLDLIEIASHKACCHKCGTASHYCDPAATNITMCGYYFHEPVDNWEIVNE